LILANTSSFSGGTPDFFEISISLGSLGFFRHGSDMIYPWSSLSNLRNESKCVSLISRPYFP